jgi:hypothetical protein
MFDKLLSRPLTIEVKGQTLSFNSVAEFDFAMSGRTEVPARKISGLIEMSARDLKKEARSIKAVERQFVDILSKAIESREGVGKYLRKIDPHVFSQDHNWRDIMVSLREKDDDYDELRKIALVKYMQYLTARQEVIKHTYSVKKMQARLKSEEFEGDDADNRDGEQPGAAMRETVILDSMVLQPARQDSKERFMRLPKGEAVILPMGASDSIDVLLSKHGFSLKNIDGQLSLIDDTGTRTPLQPGKNIIGRDTVCNIAVDASYRDVSRLHLIIEQLDDAMVRFTDLSAHGTFLPAELIENAA